MSNMRLVTGNMINAEGKAARKKIGRKGLTISVEFTERSPRGIRECQLKLKTIKCRRIPHETHAGLRVHPLPYGAKWYQRGRFAR